MKALYLDGNDELDVALDGPALRVRRPGRADAHYPLLRVARVIAVGAVSWQPDALNACLHQHKPVAVLDRRGRFVRVLFRNPGTQFGMARRMGELLAAPRFRTRYARWRREAERTEMLTAIRQLNVRCRDLQPVSVWQRICVEQHRRWGVRPGGCYRYLLGLAAAQIASAFAAMGMPRDPQSWGRQEYRLFGDMLRLERWQQAVLLEQMLTSGAVKPGRRELTAAFESASRERDRRIAAWRERALLEIMGLKVEAGSIGSRQPDWNQEPIHAAAALGRTCHDALNSAGNCGHIPLGPRGSLRTSARIVRTYLEYDRRIYESHRTT